MAVRRFDRPLGDVLREVCGMPRPGRLHQEDMCQAMGVPGEFKYQPSGADYLVGMAEALSAVSSNPFGEKVVLFDQTVFNVLVGNCDNHLKNYSVLYRERLGEGEASPMYDVACTTLYADVAREMGVALVPSRKVDDVRAEDLYAAARAMGIPRRIAELEVGELAEGVRSAVRGAGDRLEGQGFEEAGRMRDLILAKVEARLAQLFG